MKCIQTLIRSVSFLFVVFLLCISFSCGGSKEEEAQTNTPPTVSIDSPMPFSTYTQGDVIDLSCTADDAEDGALSGDSIIWVSNIGGQIGTGSSFSKELSAGLHNIIVTATDSNGAAGTAEITIIVSSNIDAG